MTLKLTKNKAELIGDATVDEAEDLLRWLQNTPKGTVSLAKTYHLHTAVFQALAAARRPVAQMPADPFLVECLRQMMTPNPGNTQ